MGIEGSARNKTWRSGGWGFGEGSPISKAVYLQHSPDTQTDYSTLPGHLSSHKTLHAKIAQEILIAINAMHPTRHLIGPDLAEPEDGIDDSVSISSFEDGEVIKDPIVAKRKGQHAPLLKLSNEVLVNIIKQLHPVDQIITALTCHFLYDLVLDTNAINNFTSFVPQNGGFMHVEEEEAYEIRDWHHLLDRLGTFMAPKYFRCCHSGNSHRGGCRFTFRGASEFNTIIYHNGRCICDCALCHGNTSFDPEDLAFII